MKVLQDRMIVKRDDAIETTASGLILPSEAKETPNQGTVVSVGVGRYSTETGVLMPMTVQEGDRVLFSRFGGQEVTVKEETFIVLREDEIFGILGAE